MSAYGSQLAVESAAGEAAEPRPVYIVLAGGVSLGAYEGGYVSTVVRALRAMPDLYRLEAVAGTSAGAINAYAASVEYCRPEPEEGGLGASVAGDVWLPVGFRDLYDPGRVRSASLFHHGGLRAAGTAVMEASADGLRPGCEVRVAVAATRTMTNVSSTNTSASELSELVQYLGWDLRVDRAGRASYVPIDAPGFAALGGRSPAPRRDGLIANQAIVNTILASSAFPLAFPGVRVASCDGHDGGACASGTPSIDTYHDGGVFENVPVAVLEPWIEQAQAAGQDPLVLVVDLDARDIEESPGAEGLPFGDVLDLATSWMAYARKRTFSQTIAALQDVNVEVLRARQRLPLASDFLYAFFGFFDRSFREVDYALGARDAADDLLRWQVVGGEVASFLEPNTACVRAFLRAPEQNHSCVESLPPNHVPVLRGIVRAAETMCATQNMLSPECASLTEAAYGERLDAIESSTSATPRRRAHRGERSSSEASAAFDVFLNELDRGDFRAEYALSAACRRGSAEHLYASMLEEAFRQLVDTQETGGGVVMQMVLEAAVGSQLSLAARPSLSFLMNLNQLELTANVPFARRMSVDIGVMGDWAVRSDRNESWHIFSGGPVARLGWLANGSVSSVALMMLVDAGIVFGPVLERAELGAVNYGSGRASMRPNAAIFAGIAPRILLFRRAQLDVPLRAYWICDEPHCLSVASRRPAIDLTVRVGWSFSVASRYRRQVRSESRR